MAISRLSSVQLILSGAQKIARGKRRVRSEFRPSPEGFARQSRSTMRVRCMATAVYCQARGCNGNASPREGSAPSVDILRPS